MSNIALQEAHVKTGTARLHVAAQSFILKPLLPFRAPILRSETQLLLQQPGAAQPSQPRFSLGPALQAHSPTPVTRPNRGRPGSEATNSA